MDLEEISPLASVLNYLFMGVSEQTSIISLNNINQLVLATEMYLDFFEARTQLNFRLQGVSYVNM